MLDSRPIVFLCLYVLSMLIDLITDSSSVKAKLAEAMDVGNPQS